MNPSMLNSLNILSALVELLGISVIFNRYSPEIYATDFQWSWISENKKVCRKAVFWGPRKVCVCVCVWERQTESECVCVCFQQIRCPFLSIASLLPILVILRMRLVLQVYISHYKINKFSKLLKLLLSANICCRDTDLFWVLLVSNPLSLLFSNNEFVTKGRSDRIHLLLNREIHVI